MWDQVKELLKQYESAHIIEIDDAINAFCGFVDHDTNSRFLAETQALLHYRRTPFCMMEGSNNAPLFSQVLPTPSHCYTTCRAAAVSLLHHLSCCCRVPRLIALMRSWQCCYPRKPGDKFFPCIDGFDAPKALPACPV